MPSLPRSFTIHMAFVRTAIIITLTLSVGTTRADIYEWEYVNPADPSQGKQQSSILCPGGAGVNAVPGAGLRTLNLTMAYLIGADLTNADFDTTNLTNADFTGAEVRGANFANTTAYGFTAAQLYSTASYQAGDLTGINLEGGDIFDHNDLTGWNFAGKNLTNAIFQTTTLNNADFTGALVRGASFNTATGFTAAQLYSTASYQSGDLTGIDLRGNDMTGWNFAGQNLTNAKFGNATLTNADFTGAIVLGAHLHHFTVAQLYSTASYQAGDLTGVDLDGGDLSSWNFAGQNLTNTDFNAATLINADFTGAEVRGANFNDTTSYGFTAAQLYSTASYRAGDLTGINLGGDERSDVTELTDLTGWNFAGKNLTNASFNIDTLTNANFTGAVVRGADFGGATLTNTDFTGADVRGANFHQAINFTAAQLYSTATYQAADLTGINLAGDNMAGWVFAGKNLTNANFVSATLTNADFTGAEVRGANFTNTTSYGFTAAQLYSTASYQAGDLTGIFLYNDNLTGWNFAGKNLTNANFNGSTLTNTNFTGTEVRGAIFINSTHGFTAAQLYSTASYQAGNLTGISINGDLTSWNFAGKNLANANFNGATLTNANLSQVNLTNSTFYNTTLTGTVFTGADTRGAAPGDLASAVVTNLIQPNGHVNGLDLGNSQPFLVVRNYLGNAARGLGPIPVTVDQHFVMGPGGTLQIVLDADAWDSRISFAPGIPVMLGGGTLQLTFAPDVSLATQVGRTFDLFDWTGVTPTDVFSVTSPYIWNLSKLYTTGEVTLQAIGLAGDYNHNGSVGPEDYNLWKSNFGSTTNLAADGNGNGIVDAADYTVWRDHFNAASLPLTGDYNHDGKVDAADYTLWRDTLGSTTSLAADGNGNGLIDSGDYDVWKANFGNNSAPGIGGSASVPEPGTLALMGLGVMMLALIVRRRSDLSRRQTHWPTLVWQHWVCLRLYVFVGALAVVALAAVNATPAEPLVGAYYYPWYGSFSGGHSWTQTLREHLVPQQPPALGYYSSRDSAAIEGQIDQSHRGNINFWATSWWGPGSTEDTTIRNYVFTDPRAGELKYAVHYESTGRLGDSGNPNFANFVPDFQYLAQNYFNTPNYLKVNGRPVVFIYLTRAYFNTQAGIDAVANLRQSMTSQFGVNPYLVGDDVFPGQTNVTRAGLWDAITDFDVYGSALQANGSTTAGVNALADQYQSAKQVAQSAHVGFIPAVSPGFNDSAVRSGHPAAPRYLTDVPGSAEGSLFSAELSQAALPNLDPAASNMLMVSTFNEWHEDTQIEATITANPTSVDSSGQGTYSQGYSYPGYGSLYLDLLHSATLLAGDYDGNGTVGVEDYNLWKNNFGSTTNLASDGNGNRVIDAADYTVWRDHFGQTVGSGAGASVNGAVPEPASSVLLMFAAAGWCFWQRRAT